MKNSWFYQKHVLASELPTLAKKKEWHGRAILLATLCLVVSGVGGAIWAGQASQWSPFGFLMTALFVASIPVGAIQVGKTGWLVGEIGRIEGEIERDINRLNSMTIDLGLPIWHFSPYFIKDKAQMELVEHRKEFSSFQDNADRVRSLVEQTLPPAFSHVCLEAIDTKLEELEQAIEEFEALIGKFGLSENASGQLEWKD